MRSSLRRSLAGLAAAGLLLTGCGSDSEDTADSGDTSPVESTPTAAGAPAGDATADVTAAYKSFYTSFDVALLEDGDTFAAVMPALAAGAKKAGGVEPVVKSVTTKDAAACEAAGTLPACAEVAYDVVVGGKPAIPNQTGYAVYQDDTWKVAKTTFCALAAAGSGPPPGC